MVDAPDDKARQFATLEMIEQLEQEQFDEPRPEDRTSEWRFPAHVSTVEKKVLYVLAAFSPRKFCPTSLMAFVLEPSNRIREALGQLEKENLLDVVPVPGPALPDEDSSFYRFREKRLEDSIKFLWSD